MPHITSESIRLAVGAATLSLTCKKDQGAIHLHAKVDIFGNQLLLQIIS